MEEWNWETDGIRVPSPAAEFVWVWVGTQILPTDPSIQLGAFHSHPINQFIISTLINLCVCMSAVDCPCLKVMEIWSKDRTYFDTLSHVTFGLIGDLCQQDQGMGLPPIQSFP